MLHSEPEQTHCVPSETFIHWGVLSAATQRANCVVPLHMRAPGVHARAQR